MFKNNDVEVLYHYYRPMEQDHETWVDIMLVRFADEDLMDFSSEECVDVMRNILYDADLILPPRHGSPGQPYHGEATLTPTIELSIVLVEQDGGYDV